VPRAKERSTFLVVGGNINVDYLWITSHSKNQFSIFKTRGIVYYFFNDW